MGVSKTIGHGRINIKIPNPTQDLPASSKALNQDLMDMDLLYNFKIKVEGQN